MCSRLQPRVLQAAAPRVRGCSSACRSVACAPQPAAAAFALMRCSISSSAAVACRCVSGAAPRRRLDPLGETAARRRRRGQDGALPPLAWACGVAVAGSQRSEEEGSSWRWCCMKSGSTQAMSIVGTRRAVSAAVAAAVAALGAAALALDSLGWRWRSSSCSADRSSLVCQRVSACTAAACRACTASVGCGSNSAASPRSGPPAAPPRRTCARTVRQVRGPHPSPSSYCTKVLPLTCTEEKPCV